MLLTPMKIDVWFNKQAFIISFIIKRPSEKVSATGLLGWNPISPQAVWSGGFDNLTHSWWRLVFILINKLLSFHSSSKGRLKKFQTAFWWFSSLRWLIRAGLLPIQKSKLTRRDNEVRLLFWIGIIPRARRAHSNQALRVPHLFPHASRRKWPTPLSKSQKPAGRLKRWVWQFNLFLMKIDFYINKQCFIPIRKNNIQTGSL